MLNNFLEKYFWNGIKYDMAYNWIDMLVYAFLFVGAVWLLYEKFFKVKKIVINREFMVALIGWVIFASAMRASEDAGVFESVLLITPFSYITDFAIAFPILLIALRFDKKIPYWKIWGAIGYLLGTLVLTLLPLKSFYGFLLPIGIWSAWILLFWAIERARPRILSRWNFAALSAQMFDTSSTFAALTFFPGFGEKHILGITLMEFFESRGILLINGSASWIMFAVKLALVPFILYAIDKYGESEEEKKFLKMVILILGIAMGLRNSLELGMA